MKRNLIIAVILLAVSVAANAQADSPRRLADKVAAAYLNGLGELDGKRLINGRLIVVVEDSLSEKTETHYFRSFRAMERWLKKGQRADGTPFRKTRDVLRCSRARCTFNFDGGILHNHLYLQTITFGYDNGRRYIKEIRLLDGA